jgi:signal transduction histidine kinase
LTNQPVIANEVEKEPRYLPDENLPDTRAELAIPMHFNEKVIGTLDVQSDRYHAFTGEDVLLIQSLADQVAIAIENVRLYERSRELAILEERNRLSRDLHDSVTQTLYSLTLLSEGWRRLIRSGEEPQMDKRLKRVTQIALQALKEMRLLIYQLRPPSLQKEGLIGALRKRLDTVENRSGVTTRLLIDDWIDLPSDLEECLYYVAQEALNNAIKHSSANQLTLKIITEGDYVILEVSDDGKGFVVNKALQSGGLGLASMKERVSMNGGELIITSQPGQGTKITVKFTYIPLDQKRS